MKHVSQSYYNIICFAGTGKNEVLREQPTALTEYDEPLVRRLIEKVTVFEDKFTVEFKPGHD